MPDIWIQDNKKNDIKYNEIHTLEKLDKIG